MINTPFRITGLGVPPPVVLLCRLVALGLLLMKWPPQSLIAAGALAVLFTPYIRIAALFTGAGLLWASTGAGGYVTSLVLGLSALWPAGKDPLKGLREPIIVIWDDECGFCTRSKQLMIRLDFDRILQWVPGRSGVGSEWGLKDAQWRESMYSVSGGVVRQGYDAWRAMLVRLPVFWYVALLITALAVPLKAYLFIIAGLIFFLSPLSNRLGEAAYRWVARNRHRFGSGLCKMPDPGSTRTGTSGSN